MKLAEKGALSLRQEGILVAVEGKTSLEEVLSVTYSIGKTKAKSADSPADRGHGRSGREVA